MKQILLMIGLVALVGCGKNDPPPPDTPYLPDSNSSMAEVNMPEKETGKEVTQPTTPNIEATNPEPKVDPTKHGRFIWKFETGGFVSSSPAIGSGGTAYIGSEDNKLYALNGKSGVKLWEFETGGDVGSSPVIGSDGTVYVGSYDKKLYALSGKSGLKLWEFETGHYVHSYPAFGSDGTVYVGSDDTKLYAIKTDSTGLAKSPWPMRGQNARHTGRVLEK